MPAPFDVGDRTLRGDARRTVTAQERESPGPGCVVAAQPMPYAPARSGNAVSAVATNDPDSLTIGMKIAPAPWLEHDETPTMSVG